MKIFRRRLTQFCRRAASPLVLSSLACAVACGSNKEDSGVVGGGGTTGSGASGNASGGTNGDGTNGDGTGAQAGANSGTGGGSGGSSGGASDPSNSACGLSDSSSTPGTGSGQANFEGCTGISMEAEVLAADIFILLDQSTSMQDHRVVPNDPNSPTRWEAITDALKEFISSPDSSNLRIGIQYFPLFGQAGATECNPEVYATPDVPIALLTEEHRDALLESIDTHYPNGLTPAVPALDGALRYAKDWAENNPGRPTVVLWAADGFPTECDDTSIASLEALAEDYSNDTPRVATFVVGLGPVANLQRVAEKGGTEAFFISNCPTAVEDLLASLKRVSNSPTLCEFELPDPPEGELLDPNKVNVTFTPAGGEVEIVRRIDNPSYCSGGGWFYDNQDEPTSIRVCPATCGRFGNGTIDIVLGCESVSLQ